MSCVLRVTRSNVGNPISNRVHSSFGETEMGGGKKRQTLRKMERTQKRTSIPKKGGSSGSASEKHIGGIVPPDAENVLSQIRKMRAITPYAVASRLDLRISVAKDLLQQLERKGKIEYVSGSKKLKIYKLAD
jgi:ribosomal protein S25